MGSTRLPGKMLLPLRDNQSLLYWLIKRLQNSQYAQNIVVATSKLEEDKAIVSACKEMKVPCSVGSDWDVLSRFYEAAVLFPSEIVVRVCGDSPLIDGTIIDFAVEQLLSRKLDYFSNGNEPPHYAEDGFCAEAFYFKDLQDACNNATWLSEREHVTPFIKKNPTLKKGWAQFRSDYAYKLSVDTTQDLDQVRWIFSHLNEPASDGMDKIMAIITREDSIVLPAAKLNEGYQKSLNDDRKVR
jgi:spore coat polysaccharide biosynthesis protein SpsF